MKLRTGLIRENTAFLIFGETIDAFPSVVSPNQKMQSMRAMPRTAYTPGRWVGKDGATRSPTLNNEVS